MMNRATFGRTQSLGEGVRELLEELGAEPPELIVTVVEALEAITNEITDSWGQPAAEDATASIVGVGQQAEGLTERLNEVSESIKELKDELDKKPDAPKGFMKIAKTVGPAAGGVAGVVRVAELSVRYRVDQVLIRFYEAISKFWEYWAPFI